MLHKIISFFIIHIFVLIPTYIKLEYYSNRKEWSSWAILFMIATFYLIYNIVAIIFSFIKIKKLLNFIFIQILLVVSYFFLFSILINKGVVITNFWLFDAIVFNILSLLIPYFFINLRRKKYLTLSRRIFLALFI